MLSGKQILLIISGSVAAYKSLDLIRLLGKAGARVRCILTTGGEKFITPLAVSSLSGEKTFSDLFSLTDETEMGHIRLSREADLIVVAPASADLLSRMAQGQANDLASCVLLASNKDILVAPAMNPAMWEHPATRENWRRLKARGLFSIGPIEGDMACREDGVGRMAEPEDILSAITSYFSPHNPLTGKQALVTSGPTHESIDPVRYIGNHSSGKQGHAIAVALAEMGAKTTLISGPTILADPAGVTTIRVKTACQMLAACEEALPAHIAVCAAAVADWRITTPHRQKIKKHDKSRLHLTENPDILARLSKKGPQRPDLVVGFAAETGDPRPGAHTKRQKKGCDWILANDVSSGVFGAEMNCLTLIDQTGEENWPEMSKKQAARRLAKRIAAHFTDSALTSHS